MSDELWRRSALELAELIRTGQASAREVVEAHLRRIDEVNPELNAVVVVLADRALAEADEADRRSAAGEATGPLHGVPVTIKENLDVAGTATTQGVKAFEGMVAPVDATLVARLRAGGAIVIGRTNLPDMGLRVSTDSSLRGLTRNPWHPGKTAGGSSAAKRRRWLRACRRSGSATTSGARCATRPTAAGSPRSSRRPTACRTRCRCRPRTARSRSR